jgi:hypothetical protein
MLKNVTVILLVIFLIFAGVLIVKKSQKDTTVNQNIQNEDTIINDTSFANSSEATDNTAANSISPAQNISLSITQPQANATVTSPSLTIKGKTESGATVFINEKESKADAQGMFSIPFTLEEGENYFVIVAADENGNSVEHELTVTYEAK